MAVKGKAARPAVEASEEVSEREFQATVNRAVEDTEQEIFSDALGEEELDNDGDTTLEDMGEGLEGEQTEGDLGDEEVEEGEEEESEDEGEEDDEPEIAEGDEEEEEPQRDPRGRFQQEQGRVPSGRLREETRARQQVESENAELRRQMAEMNGRLTEISTRVNAPPPKAAAKEPTPKPDMFAEPEKYEAWVLEQAESRAEAKLNERFSSFEQRQQAQSAQRVDAALGEAARGPRSFEFGAAYNALTSLDPRDPRNRATVSRIYNAGDNAEKALWDWWEQNGGPEYREQVMEQLTPRQQRQQRQDVQRGGRQEQPRHVIRPGQRLPSLNSTSGSNSRGQIVDPEMSDGSEDSVFRFATRRG